MRQHHIPEWAEQIPAGHVRTFRLTGRGVTFEVIEKVAVVSHLVLDLTERGLDLFALIPGPDLTAPVAVSAGQSVAHAALLQALVVP